MSADLDPAVTVKQAMTVLTTQDGVDKQKAPEWREAKPGVAGREKSPLILRAIDSALLRFLNAARFAARFLPPSLLCAAFDGLGYALYYLRRRGRESLLRTLREALPEIGEERELRRVARKAFGSPMRAVLDFVLLERHGDRIMERLVVRREDLDKFDKYRAEGKGVIPFTPHLGGLVINPCIAARLGRAYTPVIMSPEKTPFPRFSRACIDICVSLGCDPDNPTFERGRDSIEKIREHLLKGGVVGLTFDMPGRSVVEFFGQPAAVASGIAHFAYDTGARIFPGFFKRGKGPLDYEFIANPDFNYTLTGDRSTDVQAIMEKVVKQGEEFIRMAPEQWIGWFGLRSWRKKARQILEEEEEGRKEAGA
jgi:lauroyl/myristoyl acyltransferase